MIFAMQIKIFSGMIGFSAINSGGVRCANKHDVRIYGKYQPMFANFKVTLIKTNN